MQTGKVLDLSAGKAVNRRNIQQYTWNGSNAQLWYMDQNRNLTYSLASRVNKNFMIDLAGGKAAAGKNAHVYFYNGSDAQQWYLTEVKEAKPTVTATPTPKPTSTPAASELSSYEVSFYGNRANEYDMEFEKSYSDSGASVIARIDIRTTLHLY